MAKNKKAKLSRKYVLGRAERILKTKSASKTPASKFFTQDVRVISRQLQRGLYMGRNYTSGDYNYYGQNASRFARYADYELMDREEPIISSALDQYESNVCQKNDKGEYIEIVTDNNDIKEALEELLYDVINIDFNLPTIARGMCKFGDFFALLTLKPGDGVTEFMPLNANEVNREETWNEYNEWAVYFTWLGNARKKYKQYEVAHFRIITDSSMLPYGKCLASNSYVETEYGSKRIDEIEIGELIWTFNVEKKIWELSKIKNKVSSGIKETIRISGRNNEIECSKEHPILVYANGKLQYKKAEDITLNDLLVLSYNEKSKNRKYTFNMNLPDTKNVHGWKWNKKYLPKKPTKDFMRFFGFMYGDGWIKKDHTTVSIALGVDKNMNKKYIGLLDKYSGKKGWFIADRENSGDNYNVSAKCLAEFLYSNGFKGGATTKRLPSWIYEISSELQLEFINGLVDADGSIFTDRWNCNRYSLELNNRELVEDVKELLRRLNIKSSNVRSRREEGETEICGVKCHRNTSYYIYFYLDGAKKLQMEKYNHFQSENFILEPIRNISEHIKQETWDIQVDSANSNFVANGIVVHNSSIDSSRRPYKQLRMMEDAMLIYKVSRAPETRIFYIDVGNLPPSEVEEYVKNTVSQIKRQPLIDDKGQIDMRYSPMSVIEDFVIPTRQDKSSKIETLPGIQGFGLEELEYILNKMFASLKIPKAYLGYDDEIRTKATLTMEDSRFSIIIERIQNFLISELNKVAMLHLWLKGFDEEEFVNFDLKMTKPSASEEAMRIENLSNKMTLLSTAKDLGLLSNKYLQRNILNLTEQEIAQIEAELIDQANTQSQITKITEQGIRSISSILQSPSEIDKNTVRRLMLSIRPGEEPPADDGGDDIGGGDSGGDMFGGGGGDDFGGDMGGDDFGGDMGGEPDLGGDTGGGDLDLGGGGAEAPIEGSDSFDRVISPDKIIRHDLRKKPKKSFLESEELDAEELINSVFEQVKKMDFNNKNSKKKD